MFSSVVTTKDKYDSDLTVGGIISRSAGAVKEYQHVVAVGPSVRGISVGDYVYIDPSRYAVRKYREDSVKGDIMTNDIVGYNIPEVTIDGNNCLILEDRDIRYVVNEYDDV